LKDVARRPSVEAGTNVPSYRGGVAACAVVSVPRPEESGARANVSSSSAFILSFSSVFRFPLSAFTPHPFIRPFFPAPPLAAITREPDSHFLD
jgi:hypothetical protein